MSHYDRKKKHLTDDFETFFIQMVISNVEPHAQRRHRIGKGGKMYDPSVWWKKDMRLLILEGLSSHRGRKEFSFPLPKEVPVSLGMTFFMPIPKATGKAERMLMQEGLIHHTKKPDVDNLEKALLDSLSKVLYDDDCQVWQTNSKKVYTNTSSPYMKLDVEFRVPLNGRKKDP